MPFSCSYRHRLPPPFLRADSLCLSHTLTVAPAGHLRRLRMRLSMRRHHTIVNENSNTKVMLTPSGVDVALTNFLEGTDNLWFNDDQAGR